VSESQLWSIFIDNFSNQSKLLTPLFWDVTPFHCVNPLPPFRKKIVPSSSRAFEMSENRLPRDVASHPRNTDFSTITRRKLSELMH